MLKPKNGKGSTCVDIAGGKTTVGINVQNYSTNHTASQYFYFTKVASPNTNKYIESKASYNSNGNYTIKTEDQLGGQVKYTYNESKGILNKVEDAKGNQISYSYDNLDRLTNVSTTNNGKTYQNHLYHSQKCSVPETVNVQNQSADSFYILFFQTLLLYNSCRHAWLHPIKVHNFRGLSLSTLIIVYRSCAS